MTNDETMQRLREKLWAIMGRRNDKILKAQKTNALVLPYFKADDEAATEILQALAAEIERAEVGALNKLRQQLWDIDEPGTNAAIGMIDERIKELQSKTGGDNAKG